ncbi:PREDICTED: adenine phosphoribosyltransferase [Bactrocera latifrons]|uniref:Adenine phosphoribosyltransferase n=1 Tax=Bactrocera latifrons TaxID=174628 RepID=A0A0K8WE68_BACLA|nr:PREDICTED: adenine phosphoribosyltransferase [Bactrocera latifrons]
MGNDDKLEYIKTKIGTFPDFPKKGIVFRDIFSALRDPTACKYLKEVLVQLVKEKCPNAEIIVGLESRGFLFNFMVATELGLGCAPVRKKGKLPGELISVEYVLEYGKDIFEMQANAIKPGQKVIIVDDLLATGGSLKAAIELVRKAGGNVIGSFVVLELQDLHGRDKLDCDVHSLIKY